MKGGLNIDVAVKLAKEKECEREELIYNRLKEVGKNILEFIIELLNSEVMCKFFFVYF